MHLYFILHAHFIFLHQRKNQTPHQNSPACLKICIHNKMKTNLHTTNQTCTIKSTFIKFSNQRTCILHQRSTQHHLHLHASSSKHLHASMSNQTYNNRGSITESTCFFFKKKSLHCFKPWLI